VFEGTPSGCTSTVNSADGCILSYNVSGRTAFSGTLTPALSLEAR
jgi:hypothetical protein